MKFNLILGILAQLILVEAFKVLIQPYTTDCYHHRLQKHEVFLISFSITEGGDQRVDFEMKDPSNNQLQRDAGRTEGYYHYNATEPGIHKYCFTNGPDVKTISLYPHSYKDTTNDWKEAGNKVDSEKLDEEFYNLEGLVDQVSSIREALISRSFTIDKANRSITTRVYWWSIFQGILLVVVCGWQVVQIKKFFDTRRLV